MKMLRKFGMMVLLVILLIVTIQAASAAVVINEFLADPSAGAGANDGEWIELHNNDTVPVVVTGYSITDGDGDTFTLPASFILGNGFIVLAYDKATFDAAFPANTAQVIEYGATAAQLKLVNAGHEITLFDDTATQIDNHTYTSSAKDVSRGRDADGAGQFIDLTELTPGSSNDVVNPIFTTPVQDETKEFNVDSVSQTIVATDASGVTYSVDDTVNFKIDADTGLLENNTVLAVGEYTITLTATDDSLNANTNTSTGTITVVDTNPPAAVTNLAVGTIGTDSINWTWTNPSDIDFAEAIILINGVEVLNTTDENYTATNLDQNTAYTIEVRTKDVRDNVNTNGVTDTQTTNHVDLVVSNVVVSPSTLDYIATAQPKVEFKITNNGNVDVTQSFNAEIQLCDATFTTCGKRNILPITIPGLDAGNFIDVTTANLFTLKFTIDVNDVDNDKVYLKVAVDPTDSVAESDTTNNDDDDDVSINAFPFVVGSHVCEPVDEKNLDTDVTCTLGVGMKLGEVDATAEVTRPDGSGTVEQQTITQTASDFSFTFTPQERGVHNVTWNVTHVLGEEEPVPDSFEIENQPPVNHTEIPDQSVDEDTDIVLDMDDFFSDPEDDALTFTVQGLPSDITATFVDGVVTLDPDPDFDGDVTVQFVADDGTDTQPSNDVLITWDDVNDKPVILQPFPEITFDEGGFNDTLDLDDFVSDEEGDTLSYNLLSTGTPEVTLTLLAGNVAKFESTEDGCGLTTAVLEVSDGVNTPPTREILDFDIECFQDEPTFNLDEPADNAVVTEDTVTFKFSVQDVDPNEDLTVEFFHGETANPALVETFTFTGSDDGVEEDIEIEITGLEDGKTYFWFVKLDDGTDDLTFPTSGLFEYTVEFNDNPEIDSFSPTETEVDVDEGDSQEFSVTASDDNDETEFEWTLDGDVVGTNADSFTFTATFENSGEHTLTVTVEDELEQNDTHSWTVNSVIVNTPPEITDEIPDQTLQEDVASTLDLKPFEDDREDDDEDLTWDVSGVNENFLAVVIDQVTDVATITPVKDVFGTDTVTFVLKDSGDLTAEQNVKIIVVGENDRPVVTSKSPVSDSIAIQEGESQEFSVEATDPDDGGDLEYEWQVDDEVVAGATEESFTFTTDFEDAGDHKVKVNIVDDASLSTTATWDVTVVNVNFPPEIVGTIGDKTLEEDGDAIEFDLTEFESDTEDSGVELTWSVRDVDSPAIVTIGIDSNFDVVTITPVENKFGTDRVTFVLTDSDGGEDTQEVTITVNAVDDAPEITAFTPAEDELFVADGVSQAFTVTVDDPDNGNSDSDVKWFVDGSKKHEGSTFTFRENDAGTYDVTVKVSDDAGQTVDEKSWTVTVATHPDLRSFDGLTTDVSALTEAELAAVPGFTLEKAGSAQVQFIDNVDLTDAVDFDNAVVLGQGVAGIDGNALSSLRNKKARITLFNVNLDSPVILFTNGLTTNKNDINLPCTFCTVISSDNNNVVFEVNHFTTFTAAQSMPSQLTVPSSVDFGEVDRDEEVTTTFTVSNTGTQQVLGNVVVSSTGADDFTMEFSRDGTSFASELTIGTLNPSETVTVTAKITVPKSEDSGKHDIGDITIRASDSTKTISAVTVNPKSMLHFKDVEVDGDELRDGGSADIKPDTNIDIEIKLENLFDEDIEIEDVEIELTIFDIDDDDDIEEESDEFDIKAGDDEKETISVKIPELLEDDSYRIEIVAEGVDENGARHTTVLKGDLDVDKEKHELRLEARVSPEEVSCSRNPTVSVRVANLGKEDEDDVVVRVENLQLGISEESSKEDLDEAEDLRKTFTLDLTGARIGTYNLEVSAFRDEDNLEDSETLAVKVSECTQVQTQIQDVAEQQISQQQQDLINRLLAQQQPTDQPTVNVSEGDNGLLWVALAVIIVLNLGLIVFIVGALVIRGGRRKQPSKGK